MTRSQSKLGTGAHMLWQGDIRALRNQLIAIGGPDICWCLANTKQIPARKFKCTTTLLATVNPCSTSDESKSGLNFHNLWSTTRSCSDGGTLRTDAHQQRTLPLHMNTSPVQDAIAQLPFLLADQVVLAAHRAPNLAQIEARLTSCGCLSYCLDLQLPQARLTDCVD